MKKFLAILLAAAMIFNLAACGKKEESTAEPETSSEVAREIPTETEAETTAAPETEAPTTAAPETEAPTEPEVTEKPEEKLLTAFVVSAMALSGSVEEKIESSAGSVELQLDLSKLQELTGMEMDAQVSLLLGGDVENMRGLLSLLLTLAGSDLDATLSVSEDGLVLNSENLLGGKSYGIAFEGLAENFAASVFNPESGSSLALSQDNYDIIYGVLTGEALEGMLPAMPSEELLGYLSATAEELIGLLMTAVPEQLSFADGEPVSETFGTESRNYDTVVLTITAKGMYEIALQLQDWAKNSENLMALLTAVETEYAAQLAQLGLEEGYFTGAVEEWTEQEIEEPGDNAMNFTFLIEQGSGQVLGLDMAVTGGEEEENGMLSVRIGSSWDAVDRVEILLDSTESKMKLSVTTTDLEDSYVKEIEAQTMEEGDTDWNSHKTVYSLDKTTNEFSLSLENGMCEIGGSYEKDGDVTTLTVKGIKVTGEENPFEVEDLGLTVILTANAEIPEAGEFTEILTMTEDEIYSVILEAMEPLQALTGALSGAEEE